MSLSIKSALASTGGRMRLLECHDRISQELIQNSVGNNGHMFHGIWISGLTQTTCLGIPDTELVSPLTRAGLLTNYQQSQVHRPLCVAYDADSGGNAESIPALAQKLMDVGVSMIVIEDKLVRKPGAKVNSLRASSGSQPQADMHEFTKVIQTFASATASADMMITARIESFTVRLPKQDSDEDQDSIRHTLDDALTRAKIYRAAGADAIMIHSNSTLPHEVQSFLKAYRATDPVTPLVVVPTSYSKTSESTLFNAGANVIIYANHMLRARLYAVNQFSKNLIGEKPCLLEKRPELKAYLAAKNFGLLLRKIRAVKDLDEDERLYLEGAEKCAAKNMRTVAGRLLDCGTSGAADKYLVPVAELLRINAIQLIRVEELQELDAAGVA